MHAWAMHEKLNSCMVGPRRSVEFTHAADFMHVGAVHGRNSCVSRMWGAMHVFFMMGCRACGGLMHDAS